MKISDKLALMKEIEHRNAENIRRHLGKAAKAVDLIAPGLTANTN